VQNCIYRVFFLFFLHMFPFISMDN
jgi:hypothetical protein